MSSNSEAFARARVGTVLKDRWHLDELLGVGGMAWVYAATHRNRNRVAIKLLVPELSHLPQVKRRFLREGYASNSVGHPGAVRVFDDDVSEDGLAFLVMELLEGKTLAQLRREAGGRLDPKVVLQHAIAVLDVLGAAHERGVIHRDIKPGNVFVTHDGQLKVLDFGIARICEGTADGHGTQRGALLGSASFMSPEQAGGNWECVDRRSDIWSLGACMFQLLAGRAVHEGNTPAERLVAAMRERARSLGALMPGMPPEVVGVVDKALCFEREDRWQNAREMQTRAEAALQRLGSLGGTLMLAGPPVEISSPHAAPIPEPREIQEPPAEVVLWPDTAPPLARPAGALGTTARYASPPAEPSEAGAPPVPDSSPKEPVPRSKVLFEIGPPRAMHPPRKASHRHPSLLLIVGLLALIVGAVLLVIAGAALYVTRAAPRQVDQPRGTTTAEPRR